MWGDENCDGEAEEGGEGFCVFYVTVCLGPCHTQNDQYNTKLASGQTRSRPPSLLTATSTRTSTGTGRQTTSVGLHFEKILNFPFSSQGRRCSLEPVLVGPPPDGNNYFQFS